MTQKLTLAGMPVDTKADSTERHRITQGKQDAEGNHLYVLAQQGMRTHIDFPGGMTVDVDTAANTAETSNPVLQFIVDAVKATERLKITFAVTPDGKVKSATSEVPGLKDLNPQSLAVIESQLAEESLKRDIQQQLSLLPDRVVKPGEFWNATVVFNAGQGQLLTFTRQCEYIGPVERDGKTLHQINAKDTDIKFEVEPNASLPFKLENTDLSIAESEGVMFFDAEAGRVVASKSRTRITGTINFTVNDQPLPSTLDLTIEGSSSEVE